MWSEKGEGSGGGVRDFKKKVFKKKKGIARGKRFFLRTKRRTFLKKIQQKPLERFEYTLQKKLQWIINGGVRLLKLS